MSRSRVRVLAFVAVCVTCAAAAQRAQQGYDLYQQALVKERGAGDLNAAIAIYERIAKDFATDRTLAAKALMRMAGCYEQLGSPEAAKTYQRIVNQFSSLPDQADVVAEARRRLRPAPAVSAGATDEPPGLMKKIREPPGRMANVPPGVPSPDGRFVALASGDDVSVRDLVSGQTRRLTTAAAGEQACSSFAWSPDSAKLAFSWCRDLESSTELKAADIASGAIHSMGTKQGVAIVPLDWAPDGRTVLVMFESQSAPESNQLAMVSVADGVARGLRAGSTAPVRRPLGGLAKFSPDSRFIAYSPDDGSRRIVVMAVENGEEQSLLARGDSGLFLAWTPRGSIMFLSDRLGTYDIWLTPVSNGRGDGAPGRVVSDVGLITFLGLTSAGTLYYLSPAGRPEGNTDLYLAAIDPATGRVNGSPLPVSRQAAGHLSYPVWSPDGRELAYKAGPAGTIGTIFIQSLDTGQERPVGTPLGSVAQFDWSPDGRALVVAGVRDNVPQIVRVGLKTGDTSVVTAAQPLGPGPADPSPGRGPLGQPRWMPDGRSILFVSGSTVTQRDLETGVQRTVVQPESAVLSLAVAPDASAVAFVSGRALMAAAIVDGRPRVLATLADDQSAKRVTWSPDGRYVIYAHRSASVVVPGTSVGYAELWRVPAAGGPAERMGLAADSILQPAISPDGRHLAFSVNVDLGAGVRVLDRFLPAAELVRR